tara:strand:+ start:225 stop:716 length:492 start_codon:yes stop_codon:yes gene_type:complete
LKRDDFSEFFGVPKDFFSTLKNWKKFREHSAVYFFLIDPPEKRKQMESDIVYIGETKHLGGISGNCRLWDYYTRSGDHEIEKVAFMRNLSVDHKTMISWLPCLNKPIAKELEDALLNAFWEEHGENPPLNRTTPMTRDQTWGISVDGALETMRKMKTQGHIFP